MQGLSKILRSLLCTDHETDEQERINKCREACIKLYTSVKMLLIEPALFMPLGMVLVGISARIYTTLTPPDHRKTPETVKPKKEDIEVDGDDEWCAVGKRRKIKS